MNKYGKIIFDIVLICCCFLGLWMAFKSYLNGNYDRVFALLGIVFGTCVAIGSEDGPSNKDIMNRLDSLDAKLTDIINKQNQIKEDNQCPNDRIIESNKSNKCDS